MSVCPITERDPADPRVMDWTHHPATMYWGRPGRNTLEWSFSTNVDGADLATVIDQADEALGEEAEDERPALVQQRRLLRTM